MNTETLLKEASLFRSCNDGELRELVNNGRRITVSKGSVIFREGEEATGIYVVLNGKVKVYKLGSDGRQHILHMFGKGEVFAEAAVFGGRTYPAYAEAVVDSILFFLLKERLVYMIKKKPELALSMIAAQAILIKEFASKLEDISLKEMSPRLAKYILEQVEIAGRKTENGLEVKLPMNKSQLASYLGTVSETLSRALKDLKDKGLIQEDNHIIVVKKSDNLKRLAEK